MAMLGILVTDGPVRAVSVVRAVLCRHERLRSPSSRTLPAAESFGQRRSVLPHQRDVAVDVTSKGCGVQHEHLHARLLGDRFEGVRGELRLAVDRAHVAPGDDLDDLGDGGCARLLRRAGIEEPA